MTIAASRDSCTPEARIVVLTDTANVPDDQMSIVRLLGFVPVCNLKV